MDLRMLGSRVLVQPEDATQAESDLVIVSFHAPDVIGTVVSLGGQVSGVKTGDVVLFAPDAGQRMEVDGEAYLVLSDDELLAAWDEGEATV